MRIGCCIEATATERIEYLARVGYDYVELFLASRAALPEDEFVAIVDRLGQTGIPCEACCIFYPRTVRLTGPDVDWAQVEDYDRRAIGRAARLGADLAQLEAVAELSPLARRLAAAFWPGPLTLVLPARPGLHAAVTGGAGTVGVRVTSSEVAKALAAAAGGALVATSANPSGAPPPTTAAGLDPALRARLDAVLDGGATPGGAPSTVVAVMGGRLELLRAGAVAFEALRAVAGADPK